MPIDNDSMDLVCASYVFHEIPECASKRIVSECMRVLKPGGKLAIVDLDPSKVEKRLKSSFRKWGFESTEPHYKDYKKRSMNILLPKGYEFQKMCNDPLCSSWLIEK